MATIGKLIKIEAINSILFGWRSFSYNKNSFAWLTNDSTKFNSCFLLLCARFRLTWFMDKNAQLWFCTIYLETTIISYIWKSDINLINWDKGNNFIWGNLLWSKGYYYGLSVNALILFKCNYVSYSVGNVYNFKVVYSGAGILDFWNVVHYKNTKKS